MDLNTRRILLTFVAQWESAECCNVFSSTSYQHFQAVLKYLQLPVSSQYAYCVTSKRQVLGGRFKSEVFWVALISSILSGLEEKLLKLSQYVLACVKSSLCRFMRKICYILHGIFCESVYVTLDCTENWCFCETDLWRENLGTRDGKEIDFENLNYYRLNT